MPSSAPAAAVSVIVPVFNAARFIAEAVASILAQTHPVTEVIVVDDGSTDDSVAAIPHEPRVRVIRKPHTDIADTVNTGVRAATSEHLAFLDADDRWRPDKLALQLAALGRTDPPDLVFGLARVFYDERSGLTPPPGENPILNGIARSALLLRRETFWRVGPLSVAPGMHDFMAWYARAMAAGLRTQMLPEVVFERRIHGANDGILRRDQQRANYFATLKNVLDQRRRQAGAAPG
jgi:glycosyltransferase involved in cell wall biosynthesis